MEHEKRQNRHHTTLKNGRNMKSVSHAKILYLFESDFRILNSRAARLNLIST